MANRLNKFEYIQTILHALNKKFKKLYFIHFVTISFNVVHSPIPSLKDSQKIS